MNRRVVIANVAILSGHCIRMAVGAGMLAAFLGCMALFAIMLVYHFCVRVLMLAVAFGATLLAGGSA